MKKVMVTKGTTIRVKADGDFESPDAKGKVHVKKGTILELLEVVYTSESMLAIERNINVKFFIPQTFIADNCEVVKVPNGKTIDSVYLIHDEFVDHTDYRHLTILFLGINAVVLIVNILTNIITWLH